MFPVQMQAGYPAMVLGPDGQPVPMMMQAAPVRFRAKRGGESKLSLLFLSRARASPEPRQRRKSSLYQPHPLMPRPVGDQVANVNDKGRNGETKRTHDDTTLPLPLTHPPNNNKNRR